MTTRNNTNLENKEPGSGKGFFYGWLIAVACFLMVFMSLGLGNLTSALYVTPVTEDLNLSRGAFSFVFSLRFISSAISSIFLSYFIHKFEIRKVIGIGCGMLVLAYSMFSVSRGLPLFYMSAIPFGIGISFNATAVVSILIERWFEKHKGLVLGIILAGSGLGGSLFNVIVADWIEKYGWSRSYFLTALCLGICAVPVLAIIRNNPADMGLKPYGSEEPEQDGKNNKRVNWEGLTMEEALRKPYFYLAALAIFLVGFLNSPVYTIAPSHLVDRGFDANAAASIMSLFFFTLAVAKIIMGFIYDKFGLKTALVICFICNMCGIMLLAFVQNRIIAIFFALVFGFSVTIETVTLPLLVLELFGPKTYTATIGLFLAITTMGVSIGTPVLNFSYDVTGSYQGMLIAFGIMSAAILSLFIYILNCAYKDRTQYLEYMKKKAPVKEIPENETI